jgi:hypothetical protein
MCTAGSWQSAVFKPGIATNRMAVLRIATDSSLNLRADIATDLTGRMYSLLPEREAWQSIVHLRAVCQWVLPAVANRSIWAWSLASEWIPVPAILHREFPCLLRRIFFMRDSTSVKPIRGGLFRTKLYTSMVSVWHTISRHYPFKKAGGIINFLNLLWKSS